MNKTELQNYLGRCLETHGAGHVAVVAGEDPQKAYWRHIALWHAKLIIAKRGFGTTLLELEAQALNREWESAALAGEIQAAMSEVLEQQLDVDSYLSGGVEAAIQFDREPTDADAAQASACRLLAEAASHFRSVQGSGPDDARIDTLIGQCVDAAGIPAPQNDTDPLQNAILAALSHLQKSSEIARPSLDGQDNDVAQNDGPAHPPSAWARHLADLLGGKVNNDTSSLIEQLIAALQRLPEQIEDA
ncbi:hypothetical protein WH91_11225 [Devosia psychrophila]|nr:hypothetical protein WH91_11225 [Devosia psychrophila]